MKYYTTFAIVVAVLSTICFGEASKLAKRQPNNFCCFRRHYQINFNGSTTYSGGYVSRSVGMSREILTENDYYSLVIYDNMHVENWHIRTGKNLIGFYRSSPTDCWSYGISDRWSEYHVDVSKDKDCITGYTKSLGSGAGPDGKIYQIYQQTNVNSTLYVELGGGLGQEICEPRFIIEYYPPGILNSMSFITYTPLSDDEIENVLDRVHEAPICATCRNSTN